ncbi:pathogenesis associated protein Cap20 [Neofusicoccum parvum]|uniref:Pathogenesis associated protein Cap20 n=3 Tax=Neofusicoccum TaxID=407951 RepID=A0ABR3T1S0_9PEZI|nr:putative pathogenesis associated protein [Neofusicoccum parvum UCRNP2]GME39999.1 pathogenesis associated protein Cap20 [Neofusicoccum parvum]GME42860.1 pathogenesis associated protein Cap20 [Neofusicoccum parvum]
MGEPLTNGEKASSHFVSHIWSYPVVADLVDTYKSNPYGQKSLDLSYAAYDRFGKPIVPYLSKPYGYVAPYVQRADSLGDKGLSEVDKRFPIVKEKTSTIKGKVVDVAYLPVALAGQGKEYLFSTYNDEYQKTGGNGIITTAKAVISTELKITADVLQLIADYLGPKKEEAKKYVQEKANN